MFGDGAPHAFGGGRKRERALHAELCEWGQVSSILSPELAEVIKASHECVLHHQMAGRGDLIFASQALTGSYNLLHCNHLKHNPPIYLDGRSRQISGDIGD
eukprot:294115-Pelagomonas_calceolata.AAC.10